MSTRSGKRINSYFHETTLKPDVEPIADSERKTRSRRLKENVEVSSVIVGKNKKRANYVSYPTTDEEVGTDEVDCKDGVSKPSRLPRRKVFKEQNLITTSTESDEPADVRKATRITRRTRKFAEDTTCHFQEPQNNIEEEMITETKKPKKGKKNVQVAEEIDALNPKKKDKKKGKKGKKSDSMIVEDIEPQSAITYNSGLNRSNNSIDSFHSAAGSPLNDADDIPLDTISPPLMNVEVISFYEKNNYVKSPGRQTRSSTRLSNIMMPTTPNKIIKETRKRKSSAKEVDSKEEAISGDDKASEPINIFKKAKKQRSNIKDTVTMAYADANCDVEVKNSTFDKENKEPIKNATYDNNKTTELNTTYDKDEAERQSILNTTFDKLAAGEIDITFDKESENKTLGSETKGQARKSIINTTYEKSVNNSQIESAIDTTQRKSEIVNTTFEKDDLNPEHTRKSIKNTTFDKDLPEVASDTPNTNKQLLIPKHSTSSIKNTTFDEDLPEVPSDTPNTNKQLLIPEHSTRSSIKNTTFDKDLPEVLNTTFEKDDLKPENSTRKSIKKNTTFDKDLPEVPSDTPNTNKQLLIPEHSTRSSIKNTTFDKDLPEVLNTTFEKDVLKPENSTRKSIKKNTTFDKDLPEVPSNTLNKKKLVKSLSMGSERLSTEMNSTFDKFDKPDSTFDKENKLDTTFDKNSKSSLISSDNSILYKSDISRISITSDESKENIVNTTTVLIESSLDESAITSKSSPKSPVPAPLTPLKREGTFTKDQEVSLPIVEVEPLKESKTPTKRMTLPSPGCTPFHLTKSSSNQSIINVTRSIEKSRRSSLAEPLPRATKVMFCSPVNNPIVVMQQRRKVIKSNLKGSNKSFVVEETGGTEPRAAPRKRSYTHNDADDLRAKRTRLQDGPQHSVERLSRPRTSSATAKLAEPTTPSKKTATPKKEPKISRTKLPNFAALHQKQFDKMESLDECQERRAKRAKQLLTPTGAHSMLERISPRENTPEPQKPETLRNKEQKDKKNKKTKEKNPETPIKSLPTLKSLNPGYTRFGFKLNLDVNPFSVPSKNESKSFSFSNRKESKPKALFTFSSKKDKRDNTKPLKEIKANLKALALPSLAGTTSVRKETAKQSVMREKSFSDKRNLDRSENRTVIKGVRTNRRFELQMRMRNID